MDADQSRAENNTTIQTISFFLYPLKTSENL